ncbi:MAG: adenylate/guanylate cyclase domain-containing protein, partial [Candidatus Binatia bacterium]
MPLNAKKAEKKTKARCARDLRRGRGPSAEAAHDLVRWILTDGRIEAIGEDPARDPGNPERFINGLCGRIVSSGVRLRRVAIYAETLHPQIRGFGWRWWHKGRFTEEVKIAQGRELTQAFLHSPIRCTIEQGLTLRRRLDATPSTCPLQEEFQGDGCKEYFAMALNCINRRYPIVVWGTDRIDGFNDFEIALLEKVRPALSAVIQVLAVLRTARGLFSIYFDRDVGQRVIDGQIMRGHADSVSAIIMATDLRGFTSLSNRLPAEQVIGILDDFFEIVVSSVRTHGGNVLKFIGDGVLAIFGTNGAQDQAAAREALSAARNILRE